MSTKDRRSAAAGSIRLSIRAFVAVNFDAHSRSLHNVANRLNLIDIGRYSRC